MTTILVKDALRTAIEAASGGKQTVLYTPKGQPTFVNIIPKVNIETLNPALGITGVHPAFKSGDKEISQLYIGTYQGSIVNGELLSLPNVDANSRSNTLSASLNAAKAIGKTWHVMTNAEFALIQALAISNGFNPHGQNTNAGFNSTGEHGRRVDGKNPGDAGDRYILTGSGPVSFRHDGSFSGISDITGSVWERTPGARMAPGGEIQIYGKANEAAEAAVSVFSDTDNSEGWYAFDASTGELIPATFTGSMADGTYVPTTPNSVRAKTTATNLAANEFFFTVWGSVIGQPTNTLPSAVKLAIELYGLWPTITGSAIARASETARYTPDTQGARHPIRSLSGPFQFGLVGSNAMIAEQGTRPVYYAPLA
ncbi:hypothetical protein [Klebsiella sp. Ap-874]|uniref:hypothetical protein n=1 Tax=Klebsiella sp. Ap-874 TaxID=2608352 RepID=UPI001419E1E6|nr:hypothetical protein [Klebsiella sp. Ap-874]NIG47352.1 hypothetical protein [Klebsiella sp. Ap-874]NIG72583.1 hypothetical protein [Klebsiella sp. Ap-873]